MAWNGEHGEKEVIQSYSGIPDYDHSKTPFYYDYQKQKWIYKNEKSGRANDYRRGSQNEVDIEEYLDEKLEEGIDGYKEDTYWGETWDLADQND